MSGEFDKADLEEVCAWMSEVLGAHVDPSDFPDKWKTGVLLCDLANKLRPGIVAKVNKGNVAFLKLENIENFTKAARAMGVIDRYNFVSVDLYEEKNLKSVLRCLLNLKRDLGFGFNQHKPKGDVFDHIQGQ
jgi:transgelin